MLPGSESQPPPGPDSLRWAGTGSAQRARAQTTSARIRLVSLAAASERTLGGRRSVIYPPSTATGGPARVLPRPCPPILSSEKPDQAVRSMMQVIAIVLSNAQRADMQL